MQTRSDDAIDKGRERVEEFNEVLDRMNDWQRYAAYSSFGLNGFFILWGLLYCILKCCCCRCGGTGGKRIKELERLLALQLDRSAREEKDSSRLELARQQNSMASQDPKSPKHSPSKSRTFEEDEL